MKNFIKSISPFLQHKKYENTLLRGNIYFSLRDREKIERHQIERFNIVWEDAYKHIPLYEDWKKEFSLPNKIGTLAELACWPVISKKKLQENPNKLLRKDKEPTGYAITGGSTGEPLHLPSIPDTSTAVSQWIGRAGYGIIPGDKTFLLWGHHHLYGKGFKRQCFILKRKFCDVLSNYYRYPAYDLSKKAMLNAIDKYNSFAPDFFIGFSAATLSFCRIAKNAGKPIQRIPKCVMCTSGPLNELEKEEISSFFQAPICMEYGSVESGVMAYTLKESGKYRFFWDTHLIQGRKDSFGEIENIVTNLDNRYFPLIRYQIGDYLNIAEQESKDSILEALAIKGRPNDIISLPCGVSFFGAVIGDCVKQIPNITGCQMSVQDNTINIYVTALTKLTNADFNLIEQRLKNVVSELNKCNIILQQKEHLFTTAGGKTPLVLKQSN